MKLFTILTFVLIGVQAFSQQAGSLDPTFDEDGIQIIDLSSTTTASGLGIQSSGKIILSFLEEDNLSMKVARFLEDGSYDFTFGNIGMQTVQFPSGVYGYPTNLTIQSDDKIVIGCSISNELGELYYGVVRLDEWGNMDNTFGDGGVVMTAVDIDAFLGGMSGIAQQPDGKILVFGTTSTPMNNQFVLFRLLEDGSMDSSFGGGEYVYVNATMYGDSPWRAYFTEDNKILIGGSTLVPTGGMLDPAYEDILVVKLNEDGTPDTSFAEEGRLMANLDDLGDQCSHLVIQEDGSIFAAGYITDGEEDFTNGVSDFLLCKFTPDGAFDETFGTNGYLQYDLAESNDILAALLQDEDGNLILVGSSSVYPDYSNVSLLRVTTDGTPDANFGVDGVVQQDLYGSLDDQTTALITPDNKIVVCGRSNISGAVKATVARFLNSDVENQVAEAPDASINLYPNPASDQLSIKGQNTTVFSCRIFDSAGSLIFSQTNTQLFTCDVSSFANGVYQIEITDNMGAITWHRFVRL